MQNKVKVLFVVSEFYQAGTQRFTYELDRSLNMEKFSVEILCLLPLNSSNRFTDYYYLKHLELGTKIHFIDEINQLTVPTFSQKIKMRLFRTPYPDDRIRIKSFFDEFDCISVLGEYNFKEIHKYIKPENKGKLLIHIQNSKYQVKLAYAAFPKEEEFHFVSGFHEGQIETELSEFSTFKHTYFNLNFKFENHPLKQEHVTTTSPKIGIFTRLTPAKPLDPFIYAFQLVLDQIPNAEFHIYGSGDPEMEGVSRYVNQLNLQNKVFFRGHQDSVTATAVKDNLDLVWLHGYHGLPGGWVGFDISTVKIPQLFWNFGKNEHAKSYPFFPMFNSLNDFANKSVEVLTQTELAKNLANEQFLYTDEHYNIEKNIHVMEELYSSLIHSEKSIK
jgi:glycosyltransferase involved in cell wall biosynthesis